MKPRELAESFSTYSYEEAQASMAAVKATEPAQRAELARAIRKSFKKGDEQGNGRRLEALVELEGAGTLDVMRAVLENKVEVGGIYSNLRNTALELIRDHFVGEPSLEAPLRKAMKLDEYLNVDALYPVLAPYDPARAKQLLVEAAEQGTQAAIAVLAREPDGRALLLGMLDKAIATNPDQFLAALGDLAADKAFAHEIAPHAPTVPAAAVAMIASSDLEHVRALAGCITDEDKAWGRAAIKALAALPPDEAFDRASVVLTAKDRAKTAGRERIGWVTAAFGTFARPLDPRWLAFLTKRLKAEDNAVLRGYLFTALVGLGPDAAKAVIAAPRDDKDKYVLEKFPYAIKGFIEADGKVRGLVEAAVKKATGKHKTGLARALKWLDSAAARAGAE